MEREMETEKKESAVQLEELSAANAALQGKIQQAEVDLVAVSTELEVKFSAAACSLCELHFCQSTWTIINLAIRGYLKGIYNLHFYSRGLDDT